MKKRFFPMLAMVGLAMATTFCLSACDNDDDSEESSSTTAGTAVDLGLSVKWASCNIGATIPADYGNYYAWGETVPKKSYTSDNSVTDGDGSIDDFSGTATYDAASANWGGTWRMPTKDECEELVDECTWTWTTQTNSDGKTIGGYRVKGTNGNSIFLPAAGRLNDSTLEETGNSGFYWSSQPVEDRSDYAYVINFDSSDWPIGWGRRYVGSSIRPVTD